MNEKSVGWHSGRAISTGSVFHVIIIRKASVWKGGLCVNDSTGSQLQGNRSLLLKGPTERGFPPFTIFPLFYLSLFFSFPHFPLSPPFFPLFFPYPPPFPFLSPPPFLSFPPLFFPFFPFSLLFSLSPLFIFPFFPYFFSFLFLFFNHHFFLFAVGVFACFSFLVLYKEALEGYLLLSGMLLLVFLSYPNTDFCVLNSQWTLFPYYS